MADMALPPGYEPFDASKDLPAGYESYVPEQMQGALRYPAMAASALAKGALTGVGAVGDLQGMMQNAVNPYADAVARMMGATPPTQPMRPPTMSSANLTQAGRELGAVDRPNLQPQNAGERYLSSGAEGVGSMMPFALAGPGGVIGNAIRGVVQGGSAGLGGQAGADLVPSYPGVGRAIGSIAGLAGSGAALGIGGRIANATQGASSPTLDAYRSLGIDPSLAGDVTGNKFLQMAQATAAKTPFGAGPIHTASEKAIDQWGGALEDTAASLGASKTLQGAGDALQGESKNWLSQWKQASQQAWQAVDKEIPANTPVPATNYAQTLNAVRSQMPGAPATAKTLQPALSQSLLDNLIDDTKSGPLSWQDMRGIRTRIGEMISDPKLVGDTGYTDLKRIYGALSDDLSSAVQAQGPNAVAAFDNASAITRNGHSFVENVLSRILKGDQISPEKAAATVLNTAPNGGTLLGAIRQEMPQAADELAAYKLRDMGAATAGQQNATATRLSPGTFVTDKAKLSQQAHDALFGSNPALAQRIQDLATVGDSMKQTAKFLNTSNTGTHNMMTHVLGGAGAGFAAGGVPGALYGALGVPATEWLTAKGVTSPAVSRLMTAPSGQTVPWALRLMGNLPGALVP